MAATDVGYMGLITRASNFQDRELVQLSYIAGTNSASAEVIFCLLPPSQPTEADGTWDSTEVTSYPFVLGAGAIISAAGTIVAWPSHHKTNLAGRVIIPAGWAIVARITSVNMNGTIEFTSITRPLDA